MDVNLQKIDNLYLFRGQVVPTVEKDINDLESEDYKVIKKIIQQPTPKSYRYYYIVQCKHCGKLKKICSSDWTNQKLRKCINCAANKKRNSFIGFENNAYKVIELDKDRSTKRRLFYNVQCKKCGQILSMRKDTIINASNKGCSKCIGNGKIPVNASPYNVYYNHYYDGATSRGFEWNLTKEEFNKLIHSDCYYCGAKPTEIQSLKRHNKTNVPILVNGIDRVDSNKGYTIDNCVPCCTTCNRMKLDYSLDYFYNHICKIYNNIKSSQTISEESTLQAHGSGSGSHPIKDDDIVESA